MDPNSHRPQLEREQRVVSELQREFRQQYGSPVELLAAKATSDAVDRVVRAMEPKPLPKPQKPSLEDCLHALDCAVAAFVDFDEPEVNDVLRDLWRDYHAMEMAINAYYARQPSDPEPYPPEAA